MYCFKCGKEIQGNPVYCPNCGATLGETDKSTPFSSYPSEENSLVQAESANVVSDGYAAGEAQPVLGMKWFKFIIYFQLWAGMLVYLVTAGKYLTGAYYEGSAEMVYDFFPALQPLDIVMGVFCLALAVYAVVVQRALAKFRAKGPMMYYLIYIVSTAGTVLYLLIASIILGQSVFTAEVAGSIIGSLVMIFINIPYFNNRKHLFVNP